MGFGGGKDDGEMKTPARGFPPMIEPPSPGGLAARHDNGPFPRARPREVERAVLSRRNLVVEFSESVHVSSSGGVERPRV